MTTVLWRLGIEVRVGRLLCHVGIPRSLVLGAAFAAVPISAFAFDSKARVVRVIDGDTIEVSVDGRLERVRLIGVDAAELRDTHIDSRVAAGRAEAFAAQLALDRNVTLVVDPRSGDQDRYGRLLRYVYLPDGRLLNAELISSGNARALRGFPHARQDEFLGLEKGIPMSAQTSQPKRDSASSARIASAVATTLVMAVPGASVAQTETSFSPILLTRSEQSLRALLDSSVVGLFTAGLLLPFTLPLIMSAAGRGWRWCLGVTGRCMWPWAALTTLALAFWGLLFFSAWLHPLVSHLGIAPEYFLERGQSFTYQGLLFGIGRSIPLKDQPLLSLAYLVGGPTVGTSLAWLAYKQWARSAAPLAHALRTASEQRKGIHKRA